MHPARHIRASLARPGHPGAGQPFRLVWVLPMQVWGSRAVPNRRGGVKRRPEGGGSALPGIQPGETRIRGFAEILDTSGADLSTMPDDWQSRSHRDQNGRGPPAPGAAPVSRHCHGDSTARRTDLETVTFHRIFAANTTNSGPKGIVAVRKTMHCAPGWPSGATWLAMQRGRARSCRSEGHARRVSGSTW